MQPSEFGVLSGTDALWPIVSGALTKLIRRVGLAFNAQQVEESLAEIPLWMMADIRGAARAAVLAVREPMYILIVFRSGMADLLYANQQVHITATHVIFNDPATGLESAAQRYMQPEVDAWAATKAVAE